jgi:hypothetical protein
MGKYRLWLWLGVLVAACNSSGTSPAPAGAPIDMSAAAWQIRYSPGMPAQPSVASGGWQFAFPSNAAGVCPAPATQPPDFNVSPCHHVDYVTVPYASPINTNSMVMTFDVIAQAPAYGYRTAPDNTCNSPAEVRLLLEHTGDAALSNPVYRWWSNPVAYTLDGSVSGAVLTAPLTPDQWSDVNGQLGSSNPAAFADALSNVGAVGMTFGGGCFYGHGVYLDSGSATFVVTKFVLQ